MAIGDDAVAAGMTLVDGATTQMNAVDDAINETRDFIARGMGATAANTPEKVVKRSSTGNIAISSPTNPQHAATKQYTDAADADTKSAAVTAAVAATTAAASAVSSEGTLLKGGPGGRISVGTPTASTHAATKAYADAVGDSAEESANVWAAANMFPKSGGTVAGNVGVTGDVFVPNAVAATSGYQVAYINGPDGKLCKGSSSERYKDHITPIEALALGPIFPDLYEYVMRGDPDETVRVGHIAERLAEAPDLERFVIYKTEPILDEPGAVTGYRLTLDEDGHPIPDSIDFISLLLAQTAQLHARVAALEARA